MGQPLDEAIRHLSGILIRQRINPRGLHRRDQASPDLRFLCAVDDPVEHPNSGGGGFPLYRLKKAFFIPVLVEALDEVHKGPRRSVLDIWVILHEP